ncbi:type-F conjugative transfer system secretin TraK [Lelliottia amnigena]|uniref:TraK domain-containing protein n=1 Tax=Lelliottia TaxID=1330545 RepID=UPI00192B8481|nr:MULTISPECIES: type-F conjugative transfer system secretin TraK [Lelliottia]MBL5885661.1 type-F conjugative transfer system secretin TraK [Lelliottia aquatilis]MBL5923239.1 type-F conjugative transfer system secretin TraK [Lelliottia amnigena]MBL5932149.1 type-F conjugative transfer system secretin TraK [Lelliottia amnigena]
MKLSNTSKFSTLALAILLATSHAVNADEYKLPATINNPVVMPVGADSFKNAMTESIAPKTQAAEQPKPTTDLPTVTLSKESNSSPAVSAITSALEKNPTLPGYTAQQQSGQLDAYGRAVAQQNVQGTGGGSKADELYEEARNRYREVQRVNVPPGGNIVLPVSRGLQNRISTSFKNASVSTSTSEKDANIFVNGGDVFISTNTDKPIGIMLSEDAVPESTYNLTLVPLDVPGAMISVTTSLSPNMKEKRETSLDQQQYAEMLEKSQQEDMQQSDPKQDDHKQRVIDILTPVALGEVPSGFSLQEERLSRIPAKEQSPCNFNMYAKLGQRLVGARELIDVILVKNDQPYSQVVPDQQCVTDGVIASAIFDKAFLQPGEETELYIVRDKLFKERESRVTTRPSLIKR